MCSRMCDCSIIAKTKSKRKKCNKYHHIFQRILINVSVISAKSNLRRPVIWTWISLTKNHQTTDRFLNYFESRKAGILIYFVINKKFLLYLHLTRMYGAKSSTLFKEAYLQNMHDLFNGRRNYLSMRCTFSLGLGHDMCHASHDVRLSI